jgi:hypothetical protein
MNTITLFRTKKEAIEYAGNCTKTSKMPCDSYSLPTENCITGSKLAKIKNTPCFNCYANKGNYHRFKSNILPMQKKRLHSIKSKNWVNAMIKLINNQPYFRWHDSGDIQSIEHFHKICLIAEAMPKTLFWIPTREYSIIKDYAKDHVIPKNLIVRLSAMFIDERVKIPQSLSNIPNITTANVHSKNALGFECIASKQNNECRDCRACWNTDIKEVSYKQH